MPTLSICARRWRRSVRRRDWPRISTTVRFPNCTTSHPPTGGSSWLSAQLRQVTKTLPQRSDRAETHAGGFLGLPARGPGGHSVAIIGHTGAVIGVACATLGDGTPVAVTAGDDETVRVWDLADRTALGEPMTGHTGGVRGVACATLGTAPRSRSPPATTRRCGCGTWPTAQRSASR